MLSSSPLYSVVTHGNLRWLMISSASNNGKGVLWLGNLHIGWLAHDGSPADNEISFGI